MRFEFLDHLAAVIDLFAAPALVVATLPIYWNWARNLRGRKTIQVICLALAAGAFALDAADRLGLIRPTRAQVVATMQRQIDNLQWPNHYRPNLVRGEHIADKDIPLDGYDYEDNTFDNVRLRYDGKTPASFRGNVVRNFRGFVTSSGVVYASWMMMREALEKQKAPPAQNGNSGAAYVEFGSVGKLTVTGNVSNGDRPLLNVSGHAGTVTLKNNSFQDPNAKK